MKKKKTREEQERLDWLDHIERSRVEAFCAALLFRLKVECPQLSRDELSAFLVFFRGSADVDLECRPDNMKMLAYAIELTKRALDGVRKDGFGSIEEHVFAACETQPYVNFCLPDHPSE